MEIRTRWLSHLESRFVWLHLQRRGANSFMGKCKRNIDMFLHLVIQHSLIHYRLVSVWFIPVGCLYVSIMYFPWIYRRNTSKIPISCSTSIDNSLEWHVWKCFPNISGANWAIKFWKLANFVFLHTICFYLAKTFLRHKENYFYYISSHQFKLRHRITK